MIWSIDKRQCPVVGVVTFFQRHGRVAPAGVRGCCTAALENRSRLCEANARTLRPLIPLLSFTVRLREVTWSPSAHRTNDSLGCIKTRSATSISAEESLRVPHTDRPGSENGRPGPRLSAGLHVPAHRCVRHGRDAESDHRAATHRENRPADSPRWRHPSGLWNGVFGGKSSSFSLRDQTHVYSSCGDEDARRCLMKNNPPTPHPPGRDNDKTYNFSVCHPVMSSQATSS